MTKITTYNRGIIIDGHANTKEECETITLLCNSLAKDKNFKQVAYDKGYAAFEKIGKAERLRFAPPLGGQMQILVNGVVANIDISGDTPTFEDSLEYSTDNATIYTISGNNVIWNDGTILQYNSVDVLPTDNIIQDGNYTTRAASTTVTLEAGVYKISKTPNLINNGKAGITEQIITDGTVFIKDTVIQSGTEIECDGRGIQITWGGTDSSGASANGGIYIANTTPNDYIWRISEASDGSSYQYRFANLTAPTDEQFDKVLTITLTADVEISQSLYDWWTANTTKQSSKLSVDLTTLSGWSNLSSGSHTIKLVAKGTGYRDSEKSEGVSVTKAAETVTLSAGTYKFVDSPTAPSDGVSSRFNFTYKINNGTTKNGYAIRAGYYYGFGIIYEGGSTFTGYGYTTNKWGYVNVDEGTVYTEDNTIQTITLSTDQQVSQEFYTWFTANANKVYTLEAGTYEWVDNPSSEGITELFGQQGANAYYSVDITFTCPSYAVGNCVKIVLMGEGTPSADYSSFTYTLSSIGYTPEGSVAGGVYGQGQGWGGTAYKTITLTTSQTVSADFYNWAITQGNLVKQS